MKVFKFVTAAVLAAALACTALLAGCNVSLGADGRNGQDVSIYEIWEATNAARAENGESELTFLEFVSEYLNYDSEELAEMTSLQTAINRSLLSSVQVTAAFTETTSSTGNYPFWYPNQPETEETYISQGSGVIIDVEPETGDMYVVTNCHVVYAHSADEQYSTDVDVYLYGSGYTVSSNSNGSYTLDDTNAIEAEIIGASLNYDIAVLKVTGSDKVKNSDVVAATWATERNEDGELVYADDISVGETVYAIGNAAGSGISATNGIVCVDSEYITLDMYENNTTSGYFTYRTIRTSVPIYSGNSGGGLFNADGQLVGIINSKTTAASSGEYSDNISHALPAANVRRVVESMIDRYEATGTFTQGVYRAMLGITTQSNSSSAYLDNDTNLVVITEQVSVASVSSGSLASGSLEEGDVLTAICLKDSAGNVKEKCDITREYNAREVLLSAREGDTVTVTVTRSGESKTFSFTIASSNLTLTA